MPTPRSEIGLGGLQRSLGRELYTLLGVSTETLYRRSDLYVCCYITDYPTYKVVECLQLVIFDLPTLITIGDMHLSMPCNDELWQSPSLHEWERARDLHGGK